MAQTGIGDLERQQQLKKQRAPLPSGVQKMPDGTYRMKLPTGGFMSNKNPQALFQEASQRRQQIANSNASRQAMQPDPQEQQYLDSLNRTDKNAARAYLQQLQQRKAEQFNPANQGGGGIQPDKPIAPPNGGMENMPQTGGPSYDGGGSMPNGYDPNQEQDGGQGGVNIYGFSSGKQFNPLGNGGGFDQSGPAGNNPYVGTPDLPGMFSQGSGNFQSPQLNPYNFQPGTDAARLNDVFNQSTGGTINAYNTAANRLRERLDSATQGNVRATQNRYLGRGIGNSGLANADVYRQQAAGQNAYGQGLSDLSNQFESQRQQGLQTALGAANSLRQGSTDYNAINQADLSQRRNLANSNYQFRSGQDQANRQFMDKTLFDLINSREQRGANAALQNDSQRFQGDQGAQDRELQEAMARLREMMDSYRQSQQIGVNAPVSGGINGNFGM